MSLLVSQGGILPAWPECMVNTLLCVMDGETSADGTMLMDAEELVQMVQRGGRWDKYVCKFKPTNFNAVIESEDRVLRFR